MNKWPKFIPALTDEQNQIRDDFTEHLPNLPSAFQQVHRIVIPCEGRLAYSFARNISARRIFEKRFNQSYDWLISVEHLNRPNEIIEELKKLFTISQTSYFPLMIPSIELNLCI